MSIQDQFLHSARAAVPGVTFTEIARRIGVSPPAVSNRSFGAESAVAAWNQASGPAEQLTFYAARVDGPGPRS